MTALYLHLMCGNRLTMIADENESPWIMYDRARWGLQWCVCRTCRREQRITGTLRQQPVTRVTPGPPL